MSRLIDADALLDGIYSDNPKDVMLYIARFPTAEPRKGKWIKQVDESINAWWYECSVCGDYPLKDAFGHDSLSQFCPWCGADMRGEEE